MATALTSVKWRLQFQRQSFTDDTVYYFEWNASEMTEDEIKAIVAMTKKLGYTNVRYSLQLDFP